MYVTKQPANLGDGRLAEPKNTVFHPCCGLLVGSFDGYIVHNPLKSRNMCHSSLLWTVLAPSSDWQAAREALANVVSIYYSKVAVC